MLNLNNKLDSLKVNKKLKFHEIKKLSEENGYIIICKEGTDVAESIEHGNVDESSYIITAVYQNYELHDYKRVCKNYRDEDGKCGRKVSKSGAGDVCFPFFSESLHCHGKNILVVEKLMVIDASIKL